MDSRLAPYAIHPWHTRGRRRPEPGEDQARIFEEDRDRIIRCGAFKRLVYKTQVFVNHEGDMFRTRLTHSLEVAQVARQVARHLRLNEDLTECIALAHDLGHTPFGHLGQDILHELLYEHGGFEHNLQSLRVVDVLESWWPPEQGLNLSFEVREGILKHCSQKNARSMESVEPHGVAERFLKGQPASLEAQIGNLADELAYTAHDFEDGVRAGLLQWAELASLPWLGECLAAVRAKRDDLPQLAQLQLALRRLVPDMMRDLVETSRERLMSLRPASPHDARRDGECMGFSPRRAGELRQLKQYLHRNLYRHAQVVETRKKAEQVLRDLYALYMADQRLLPHDYWPEHPHVVRVRDYLSGMTDRFAIKDHRRLMGQDLFSEL